MASLSNLFPLSSILQWFLTFTGKKLNFNLRSFFYFVNVFPSFLSIFFFQICFFFRKHPSCIRAWFLLYNVFSSLLKEHKNEEDMFQFCSSQVSPIILPETFMLYMYSASKYELLSTRLLSAIAWGHKFSIVINDRSHQTHRDIIDIIWHGL